MATKRTVYFVTLLALAGCLFPERGWKSMDFKVFHLGNPEKAEWLEFAKEPAHGRDLALPFPAEVNETESTLLVWQDNVRLSWAVGLNGRKLGSLALYDFPVLTAFALPAGALKKGENTLTITGPKEDDSILVGMVKIDPRPMSQVLGESTLEIDVVEPITGGGVPCRITIVDDSLNALPPLAAKPGQRLAVRPGCVYTADGRARVTLPSGRYRIHAGRGFEYSVDTQLINVGSGDIRKVSLKIRREVATGNLVACDTHIHTLHFSGHGDSTDDERAITIAGEGIELPIATEHNQVNGYAAAAERMGVRNRFTPVLGSEITTTKGHFNIFPCRQGGTLADWKITDWPKLMESIRATTDVRVAILNHARDHHSNFVPFAPENFNPVTGENPRGFDFTFDAMEVFNSGALRSDNMELFSDWMALLNHGYRIAAVGGSDCHDVNRYIVGQGRTYIACKDADPSKIDVSEACESLLKGRAIVSLGLLAQIKVNGIHGVGDLVTGAGNDLDVEVRVSGPSWTKVERVELYANGTRIRDEWPESGAAGGDKVKLRWKIGKPKNDVHLVVVANGPGILEPYWRLARPYRANSPAWNPRVFSVTNPVYIDADGDGVFTSPRALATKVVAQHDKDVAAALAELAHYDEATAAQAASLLQARGTDVREAVVQRLLQSAAEPVRRGFAAYVASLPK